MPLPTLQQFNAPLYQPATMKLQGMKMQDQLKRTGLAEQGLEIEREGLGVRKETLEFNKMQKSLEIGKQFLPSLPKEDWKKFKGWLDEIGAPGVDFLPDDVSGLDDNGFDALKEKIFVGADNITKMDLAQYKVAMDKLKEVSKQKAALDLEDKKQKNRIDLADKKAALKKTPSEKATSYTTPMNQILKEYGGGGGLKITTKPDGTMDFSQGGEKAYQDMFEKAKTDPKAKRDLSTYEVLKKKLLAITGTDAVEASTQKRLIFKDGQFIEK